MATILRVKRRNEDEHCEAFLVACKREKLENADCLEITDSNALETVLRFAGTVKNQDSDIVDHLKKTLTKDQLKSNYKQHVPDIFNKIRTKYQEESRENRYKVVNSFRSIGTLKDEDDKELTVIDVEDSISCCVNEVINKDPEFVYDLYYTETKDIIPDDDFSIVPFAQELVFENYRDNDFIAGQDESEDSNSESNWRNDYPDSDNSNHSIDEDDMLSAIHGMKIHGEESDLSSEDSDFVHSYKVDESDVFEYGLKYAKYKAKFINESENTNSDNDSYEDKLSQDDDDDIDDD